MPTPSPSLRLLAVVLSWLACFVPAAAADQGDLDLDLGLIGALHRPGTAPSSTGPALLLETARTGGAWERAWGVARNYNVSVHHGRIDRAEIERDRIVIDLRLTVEADAWVPGGRGAYRLTLARSADGQLEGTFTGTTHGDPVSGRAWGRITPAATASAAPLQRGERPRILFRKADLPALREKAKTELGRLCLTAMGSDSGSEGDGDAVGMGVRFQITGDRTWADRAKASVARHMANQSAGTLAVGRAWGPRLEQVAVAYDLCYEAWDPAFRAQCESWMRLLCHYVYNDQQKLSTTINWHVGSNYAGPIFAGAAFAGLALLGEPGPEPVRPTPPSPVIAIAPLAAAPPAGMPVVPLVPGKGWGAWLATETIPTLFSADPLVGLGEIERQTPAPGASFRFEDREWTWQPLAAEHVLPERGISLEKGLKPGKSMSGFFATVIETGEPRLLKVRLPFSRAGRPQLLINGVRVPHEGLLRLEPGRYSVLVAIRLGAAWRSLEPWLDPATDADVAKAEAAMGAQRAEFDLRLREWESERAEWAAAGGANPLYTRLFEQGRMMMRLFASEAVGPGGYQAESGIYFLKAIDGPNRYHGAYRRLFGRALTQGDIGHYLPRVIAATVYSGAAHRTQGINAKLVIEDENCSSLFPVIPDEWKPTMLWVWNHHVGGDGMKPDLARIAGGGAIETFLNYPLGMAPAHPNRGGLPLAWQAPGFGYYSFRNAWSGGDDFVLQAFGRFRRSGGWGGDDAGALRLIGLGQQWITGNEDRETRRFLESTVQFPDNPEFSTGRGRGVLVHQEARRDGGGVVSIDLSGLTYDTRIRNAMPTLEKYGQLPVIGTGSGTMAARHLRSVGIDYSGRAGAPAVVAIVDRVDGPMAKRWFLHIADPDRVQVDGQAWTYPQGDAVMAGRFLAPVGGRIAAVRERRVTKQTSGSGAGVNDIVHDLKLLTAQGADARDGHFFAVFTIGRGPAPAMAVTGSGLDAVVRIGRLSVRFDGTKVVFAD